MESPSAVKTTALTNVLQSGKKLYLGLKTLIRANIQERSIGKGRKYATAYGTRGKVLGKPRIETLELNYQGKHVLVKINVFTVMMPPFSGKRHFKAVPTENVSSEYNVFFVIA
ncbi:hypothetical protein NDU88_006683 [Pleurodeles waltl]|uniref:60S ribosomal protein L35a n=1 Tax=Pleurodeles waltl TaxID=8319 RepID=A0AAV7QIL5_PLEWA|nr:hypothetical protein NDU88_006683 [Pleurodeles waltl]